ncbi:MAG: NAD(P)H-binding protein [Sphingomonadaceae bacterium]|nr:NAD(P)H-binding protein [Sphingomonadaceae bacterium]
MIERLVTLFGGGGFLGRYVAQELLRRGARIRIAERNPGDAFFLKPLGGLGQIQFVSADVTRPETLSRAAEGANATVNLVGVLAGDFEKLHVEGARNAARAAAEAGAESFVQVSAIGASREAESRYARTKGLGEEAVRAAMPGATIVRPSILFGPEDRFINKFAAMARLPGPMPVIAPQARFQPAYVADVARAVAAAALDPATHGGKTYELGGPQVMTMLEINRFVAEAIGRSGKTLIEVPDIAARGMARLGFLPGVPLTWDQWLMLQTPNVASEGAPGFEAFGIAPRPLAAVAEGWLVRYRDHGRFARKTMGAA